VSSARLLRVQPLVPISRKEPFDDPDWLFDFYYDGFRPCSISREAMGRKSQNQRRFRRREGTDGFLGGAP
jgi:hypothetical protein